MELAIVECVCGAEFLISTATGTEFKCPMCGQEGEVC